jgi:hypothetical protein
MGTTAMKLIKKRKIAMLLIPAVAGVMLTAATPITHVFADNNDTTTSAASSASSSSSDSSAGSSAVSGSYSSLQANAILATAYHDGYNIAVGTDRGKNQKDQKLLRRPFKRLLTTLTPLLMFKRTITTSHLVLLVT